MGSRSLTRFHGESGIVFASIYTQWKAREVGFLLSSVDWKSDSIHALAAEVCCEISARLANVSLFPPDVLPDDIEWLYDIADHKKLQLRVTHRGISIGRALGPERAVYEGPLGGYRQSKNVG